MERDFLKQSIRRELDYYRDGLFNEDGDEEWVRAWSAPDDDDSMAENGFLNVAMAHLAGDECDEIVLLGDRKSTRLNSSHPSRSRMPSSA